MPKDELLRKIDRTLERNTDAFERVDERLARHEKRDDDFQRFLEALTERHVGITQHLIEAIAKVQAEIADQRAQIQANTEAFLKVLDRLEPQQGS